MPETEDKVVNKKHCSSLQSSWSRGRKVVTHAFPETHPDSKGPFSKEKSFRDTANFLPPNSITLLIVEGMC